MFKIWCSRCGESFHGFVLCDSCTEASDYASSSSYKKEEVSLVKEIDELKQTVSLLRSECSQLRSDNYTMSEKLAKYEAQKKSPEGILRRDLTIAEKRIAALMIGINEHFVDQKNSVLTRYMAVKK